MTANSPLSEAFHTLLLRAIPTTTPTSPDAHHVNFQTKTFICLASWTRQTAALPDEVMYAQFGHDKLWLQNLLPIRYSSCLKASVSRIIPLVWIGSLVSNAWRVIVMVIDGVRGCDQLLWRWVTGPQLEVRFGEVDELLVVWEVVVWRCGGVNGMVVLCVRGGSMVAVFNWKR